VGVHLVAFVLASVVVIVVPGVDFALVTRQAVAHGRRTGLVTAAGLLGGGLSHAAFAAFGLSALVLASAQAYAVLKLAGAAYLIWLGVQTLRARRRHGDVATEATPRGPMPARRALSMGFFSDLLNVKVAVFFVTFLPQFVEPGPGLVWRTLFLGLLFNALASSWWVTYILLVARLRPWLSRGVVRRTIDRVTGVVLIAVGGSVAAERR
jgi:threonine/homoserine/homoserine lactone efflux protein